MHHLRVRAEIGLCLTSVTLVNYSLNSLGLDWKINPLSSLSAHSQKHLIKVN